MTESKQILRYRGYKIYDDGTPIDNGFVYLKASSPEHSRGEFYIALPASAFADFTSETFATEIKRRIDIVIANRIHDCQIEIEKAKRLVSETAIMLEEATKKLNHEQSQYDWFINFTVKERKK